jgi:hypothetical protein
MVRAMIKTMLFVLVALVFVLRIFFMGDPDDDWQAIGPPEIETEN